MEQVLIIFNGIDSVFNKHYSYYKVCAKNKLEEVVEDAYRKSTELIGYEVVGCISTDTFYGVVKSSKRY